MEQDITPKASILPVGYSIRSGHTIKSIGSIYLPAGVFPIVRHNLYYILLVSLWDCATGFELSFVSVALHSLEALCNSFECGEV